MVKTALYQREPPMTDDADEQAKRAETIKRWEQRLSSGEPIWTLPVDIPMKVIREPEGGLSIDAPSFGLLGFDRLGIVRVSLSPAALNSLKRALAEFEKNPGTQIVEVKMPPAN
jgi:hypothetical protein